MKSKYGFFFVSHLLVVSHAYAQSVTPTSYTATPGEGMAQGAAYNYFDDTGSQLTDHVLGTNDIVQDLGNGPAYEWVGWRVANPTLTFQFSNVVAISDVRIGFHHNTGNQTYLPSTVTIGSRVFSLTGNEVTNGTRGFVDFPGYWPTNSLTIVLSDTNLNWWIFVDEVQFLAQAVAPVSYTATPGEGMAQGGSYNYFDDTGTQLTDQVFGVNDINLDLGNGPAYEWVGWRQANPTLTFQFSNTVPITSVQIDFHHNDYNKTYLPSAVTIGSRSYALTGNELANGTRGFLDFPGYWFTNSLTIVLSDSDLNRWIFVDEIRFLNQPEQITAQIGTAAEICWNSKSNRLYQLEYRTQLGSDQWYPLGPPVLATGSQSCVLDSIRGNSNKFYRVREQ